MWLGYMDGVFPDVEALLTRIKGQREPQGADELVRALREMFEKSRREVEMYY